MAGFSNYQSIILGMGLVKISSVIIGRESPTLLKTNTFQELLLPSIKLRHVRKRKHCKVQSFLWFVYDGNSSI